jgi:hypothetical protein
MNDANFGEWQPMWSAPKDGTRILVAVRASEQGPAEVDVVRWARQEPSGEKCWISAESDPAAAIIYTDSELAFWMPLPKVLPMRGPRESKIGWPKPPEAEEMGGSGI